jgi:hypothetical protein
MESRILCFNVGMDLERQILQATQKTGFGSLESGIKGIIAPQRHETRSI